MNPLKKLYYDWCAKIYAVGKYHSERHRVTQLNQSAIIGQHSVLYDTASILNVNGERKRIQIGKNCHIYGSLTTLYFGGEIVIGDHCSIGDLSRIVSGKKIIIGNRVMIAHNVNILDNNSHPIDAKERAQDFTAAYEKNLKQFDLKGQDIIIEDDVWIGFNSIILKGVRIGRGAIIGAGSVVTKDVEAWTINVGNPLRCVEKLQPQHFNVVQ